MRRLSTQPRPPPSASRAPRGPALSPVCGCGRSISAAANQWLEDQGGFPLFTLEGAAARPATGLCAWESGAVPCSSATRCRRRPGGAVRKPARRRGAQSGRCCAAVLQLVRERARHRPASAAAGNEPEPPDHPSAAWDLPVRPSVLDSAAVSASAAADGVPAEPGPHDGDASRRA